MGDAVSVVIESTLGGKAYTRTVTCRRDDPFVDVCVTGFAARRRTVTCRSEMTHVPVSLSMDTIGGWIDRPRERGYAPTFWPVPGRVTLEGAEGALNVGFEAPTAVSYGPDHALEWIVARNPMKERAYGLLPVLAHPIGGTVDERQTHSATIFGSPDRKLTATTRERLELGWLPASQRPLRAYADSRVLCDDPDVSIVALKRADVGAGVIVRLAREELSPRVAQLEVAPNEGRIWGAFRCDAREEDDEPIAVVGGRASVPLRTRLTTVRLIVR
jgi:hypothetical protein